jgi:hypothetical protein
VTTLLTIATKVVINGDLKDAQTYTLISNYRRVVDVVFLLGDTQTCEFYVPKFRNILTVPSVAFFLLGDSPASKFNVPTFRKILSVPSVVFYLLGDSPASKFHVPTFRKFCLFHLFYSFFWVIPRRLNFMSRRFGTFCLFHLLYYFFFDGSSAFELHVPTFRNILSSICCIFSFE